MPKRISPSITAIKREVEKGIKGYFQELVDEFGPGHFDPQKQSENFSVFFALAAHHPPEAIIEAFPSAKGVEGLKAMDKEARDQLFFKGDFTMTVFGTARTLNISKADLGYQEMDLG
ncbi:MAG: hypothetical protein KA099_00810 [Alphaproteobacteria bacterium]|nr:hypothetical protein [Alphaproteobacteria bacterium]MBP7758142.1 hypothetical protein [Alphaproteobacteria bacterium]MBP7761425.1 hypothetical protein [Alphaproteobacteria bacterium]MBP7903840.1 hypothetical protein [Alphaproteobacteria bacterium]